MHDVFINGTSVISKFGCSFDEFWCSLNVPNNYDDSELHADIFDELQYNSDYESYFLDMVEEGVKKAVSDSDIDFDDDNNCIIIGTGMGLSDSFLFNENLSKDYMSQIKNRIKSRLKIRSRIIIIANACCAGAQAIGYGYDLIKTGEYKNVIAGGAEAFSSITYNGFKRLNSIDESGCKPFDKNRKGIYVGDGSVFFVLQNKKSNNNYCKILGYEITNDAYHTVTPEKSGKYIKKAIYKCLQNTKLKSNEIDAVITHGTGTKLNDEIESKVLYEIFGAIDATAPKWKSGHTGGASGAFGILVSMGMLKYQKIPPILNINLKDEIVKINTIENESKQKSIKNILINTFAFGGTNTVFLCGMV